MNLGVLALICVLFLAAGGLALRTFVTASVKKAVETRFDKELEAVRSDLRVKEAKITALQSSVLSGQANWQTTLDSKRIEAVEELWAATLRLDHFKMAATLITMLKLDAIDERAKREPKVRQFLESISGPDEIVQKVGQIGGEAERLFVPQEVWKIFAAYKGLLTFAYLRLKVMATGLGETDKMFDSNKVVSSIKEIMPHAADYLEKFGIVGAAHLVEPLRELLFDGLRAALHSGGVAEENISRIVEMTERLDERLASGLKSKNAGPI